MKPKKNASEEYITMLTQENTFNEPPSVTKVSPATVFYKAEDHHQNSLQLKIHS
jgi:peptide-methionine (S)-S-oxide reductase